MFETNMKKISFLACFSFFLAACTPLSSVYERPSGKPYEKPSEGPRSSSPADARGGLHNEPEPVREVFPEPAPDARNKVSGKVSEVIDGDRLTLQSSDGTQVKIRLSGVDAPGLRQPYGLRARDYLVKICEKKDADVVIEAMDKNKYLIGRVHCYAAPNKSPVDSTLEQLRRGVAWVMRENSTDNELKALETEARRMRRGLWIDPNPIPPWDWDAR
jgi:endonuclease YncB( thermonuclease family)